MGIRYTHEDSFTRCCRCRRGHDRGGRLRQGGRLQRSHWCYLRHRHPQQWGWDMRARQCTHARQQRRQQLLGVPEYGSPRILLFLSEPLEQRVGVRLGDRRTLGGVNAYQKYSISWQEGSATDQINVSANSYFDTLEQIVPSAAVGAQSFTAKAYKSGVLVYNVGCQLTLGTF